MILSGADYSINTNERSTRSPSQQYRNTYNDLDFVSQRQEYLLAHLLLSLVGHLGISQALGQSHFESGTSMHSVPRHVCILQPNYRNQKTERREPKGYKRSDNGARVFNCSS